MSGFLTISFENPCHKRLNFIQLLAKVRSAGWILVTSFYGLKSIEMKMFWITFINLLFLEALRMTILAMQQY